MDKKLKITFVPGCFDSFEGTQEELDQLIDEIKKGFESGEFLINSKPVDIDMLSDEDPEIAEKITSSISDINEADATRRKRLN